MSDLHLNFEKFDVSRILAEEGLDFIDTIIIAGDMTNFGFKERSEITALRRYLRETQEYCKRLLYIAGNHDIQLEDINLVDKYKLLENEHFFTKNITSKVLNLDDILYVGMSMSPCYDIPKLATTWDNMTANESYENAYYEQFNYKSEAAKTVYISHCPPYSELSPMNRGAYAGVNIGSKALLSLIEARQPDVVICGHVHENAGKEIKIGKTTVYNVATTYKFITI
jgi:Icc-related predicted phosphoesterase